MTRELVMRLFSRRPFSAESAARQIHALSSFEEGILRPETWAEFEPIRRPFDPQDLSGPVEALSSPAGTFMYRHNLPTKFSGVIWNRSRPKLHNNAVAKFPPPLFLNYWTAAFHPSTVKKVGVPKLQSFAVAMFEAAEADFGFLTSSADFDAKNHEVRLLPTGAQSMKYVGLDPDKGIPGLYWMNLFSSTLEQWLRLDESLPDVTDLKHLRNGARVLQFGDVPDDCESLEIVDQQKRMVERLGASKFFDIRHPDRPLEAPKWGRP